MYIKWLQPWDNNEEANVIVGAFDPNQGKIGVPYYGEWTDATDKIPTKAVFKQILVSAQGRICDVKYASKVFIELRFSCNNPSGTEERFYATYDTQQKRISVCKSDDTVLFSNIDGLRRRVESYRWLWGEADREYGEEQ